VFFESLNNVCMILFNHAFLLTVRTRNFYSNNGPTNVKVKISALFYFLDPQ